MASATWAGVKAKNGEGEDKRFSAGRSCKQPSAGQDGRQDGQELARGIFTNTRAMSVLSQQNDAC